MKYKSIKIDRKNLAILGVGFPDAETLEIMAEAVGSNMIEGWTPTPETMAIVRDHCLGRISLRRAANLANGLVGPPDGKRAGLGVVYDPIYVDPATGILRNFLGVDDRGVLTVVEAAATSKGLMGLRAEPAAVGDSSSLFEIHRRLFQRVYEWAGTPREVEIAKGDSRFLPVGRFGTALSFVDRLLGEYARLPEGDGPALARKLAEILDAVNHAHPFREGNGRTQRELLRLLAAAKGRRLDLSPPDDADVCGRYMRGTIKGDVAGLAALIAERLGRAG